LNAVQRRSFRWISEVEFVIVGLEEGTNPDLDRKEQRRDDHKTKHQQGNHALRVTPANFVANDTTGVVEV
jgi:hypothetical protein